MFFFEGVFDFFAGMFEFVVSLFDASIGKLAEFLVTFWVEIFKGYFLDLDANFTHLETVGEWGENFERFTRDFALLVGRKSRESAEIVQAVGELDDEDTNVLTGSDEELEEVVGSARKVTLKVAHVGASLAKLGDAINEEGDIFAKLFFDVF